MIKRMIILCLSLMLVACGDNNKRDVEKQVTSIKSKPAMPIESLPTLQPMAKTTYQASYLRNPFEVPKKVVAQDTGQPDLNRKKDPLEAFSLDSLKMVGSIKQANQVWALIQAPNGTIYPIRRGQYIGQNFGQVATVTADDIQLVEKVKQSGEWRQRNAQLLLKQNT